MTAIAYLVNSFPEASEAYISAEILELRRRGCRVLPYSFRRPSKLVEVGESLGHGTIYVLPLHLRHCLVASWLCLTKFGRIADLMLRALQGPEKLPRRIRTLVHTWLGVYLAVLLRKRQVEHIHVHHGFFASWCAMVAARFLGIGYSVTLHGSDLLLRAEYLDCKLKNCRFCFTVSEYNRDYILDHYAIARDKLAVHRVGIDLDYWRAAPPRIPEAFTLLAVGRLHEVKNHAFLILACHSLRIAGQKFRCYIAGEGEQREKIEQLINELELREHVHLLGHVERSQLLQLYNEASVVVLTSLSEGVPVTLMEAMAMQRIVLAPDITGIPELITHGETGFLYQPGLMDDFLAKLIAIKWSAPRLTRLLRAARHHVERNYNSQRNLALFADDFLERIALGLQPRASERLNHEDSLLQQIQLRV